MQSTIRLFPLPYRPLVRPQYLAVGTLVTGLYFGCPYRIAVVQGNSMAPTMKSGEVVVLDQGYYRSHPVAHGDVITFVRDGEVLTKRVYGIAGDRLTLVEYDDGTYRIPLEREISLLPLMSKRLRYARVVRLYVPYGKLFVLGDNRGESDDSRQFGFVDVDSVVARTIVPAPGHRAGTS